MQNLFTYTFRFADDCARVKWQNLFEHPVTELPMMWRYDSILHLNCECQGPRENFHNWYAHHACPVFETLLKIYIATFAILTTDCIVLAKLRHPTLSLNTIVKPVYDAARWPIFWLRPPRPFCFTLAKLLIETPAVAVDYSHYSKFIPEGWPTMLDK